MAPGRGLSCLKQNVTMQGVQVLKKNKFYLHTSVDKHPSGVTMNLYMCMCRNNGVLTLTVNAIQYNG